jgi:putative Ca2+/H+ antiporter (TMEM165/GDT1 family)
VTDRVLYGIAAVAYVALGVFVPEVLFSWIGGVAFLLVAVWLVPALVRRVL